MIVTSCAVGPDFLHPAAPEITRYTREPLTRTSSTDVASGQRQVFLPGRDIPEQWWALFRSPRLNGLIAQALHNNPSLQSALASLRAAK
jgi:outer membrane protein TolC